MCNFVADVVLKMQCNMPKKECSSSRCVSFATGELTRARVKGKKAK